MRLKQPMFYRQTGVRQKGQLMRPRLVPISKLVLPQESIYHFAPEDSAVQGPSPHDPLFQNTQGRVFIEHITQLKSMEGAPRRTVLNPLMLTNEYRRKNRLFKPLRKDQALTINPRNILVINYAMLTALYRYIPSFKASYFRWKNIAQTFWETVEQTHQRFGWNQFIELELPERIPTYAEFKMIESSISARTLDVFNTPAALNLLDIWHWLGDHRERSTLSLLSEGAYEKIHWIVRVKGHFFVINLGLLDEWRKDKEVEGDSGFDGTRLQRIFLNLLYGLQDLQAGVTQLGQDQPEVAVDDRTVEGIDLPEADLDIDVPAELPTAPELGSIPKAPTKGSKSDSSILPGLDDLILPEPVKGPDLSAPVMERPPVPSVSDRETGGPEVTLPNEELQTHQEEVESPSLDEVLTRGIESRAWELHELGMMSPRAYQRVVEDAQTYKRLKDPFGSGQTLAEAMAITPDDLDLPDVPDFPDSDTIVDKSMLSSKLKGMQRKYVKDVLHKDIMQAVLGVQTQGVTVKDYKVETVRDAMNHYQIHSVTLKPVRGRQSTVRFRLPVVDADGRFISNGTQRRLRLQRADVPIRKVNPTRVALTSYYNKTFVDRSERSVNNYDRWLIRQITDRGLDPSDQTVTDVRFSNVFLMTQQLPRIYTMLARRFAGFTGLGIEFHFDYNTRAKWLASKTQVSLESLEQAGQVVVGVKGHLPVTVDANSIFYIHTEEGLEVLGTLPDILGLDRSKAPLEVAEMSVSNKILPVGLVLGYQMGLSQLLQTLGCEVVRLRRGERRPISADEYTLVFEDEVLVLSRLDQRSSMILAGFNRYHQTLKQYSVWDFDRKDVYYRVLEEAGLGVRYLREVEALFASWVDPITRGLLEDMGEPTEFQPLLLRAVELLQTDYSPEEVDGAFMRYRGYERFAGIVYGELIRAAKSFNARIGGGENAVELNPHAVWMKIDRDPAVAIVEENNPIANLREQEVMTYRGDGGRSGKSMVERTRIYHKSDVGVVSESTVDSGDVGVVAYLSPDANFINLRGVTRPYDKDRDGPSRLLSSSALLAPGSMHDDTKRIGFISIQQQQGMFADGYEVMPLRTGYEQIVAQRTTDLFAKAADADGVVVDLSKHAIVVRYDDGSESRVELGKRFGSAAGITYPHELVTRLKKGDKVQRGDILAYNAKFFEEDWFNPTQVSWKAGVLCRTAVLDNIDTLEDGSVISEEVARKLNSQTTEKRIIQVRFDQSVQGLVKEGDEVDLGSILCTIEDPEIADHTVFDEASLDTLRRLSAMTPRASVKGVVSKVEVFYHGDFEDLSPSLQAIAGASDRARKRLAKALGQPATTGEVDTSFRVRGKALDPDTLAIVVYIDHQVPASVGDKGVFGNQLKTVFSRVMTGVNTTESGEPLDAIFGNTSIEERIVLSPKLIGTTNTLLKVLSKHVAAVYRGTAHAKAKS